MLTDSFHSFMAEAPIIYEPFHWFAKQMNEKADAFQ